MRRSLISLLDKTMMGEQGAKLGLGEGPSKVTYFGRVTQVPTSIVVWWENVSNRFTDHVKS